MCFSSVITRGYDTPLFSSAFPLNNMHSHAEKACAKQRDATRRTGALSRRKNRQYVEENFKECEPAVDLEFVTSLSAGKGAELHGEEKREQMHGTTDRLHKDYYSIWAYETPRMSPSRMGSTSPQYNAPSPSYSFPSSVSSSAASSPVPRRANEGILDDLSDVESDHEENKKEVETPGEKKKRQEKSIVEGELWLLTWLAQDDHNLQFLIRSDVVDSVVSYLRSTRDPDFRTYRVLRRMATHRTYVYRLLDLEFHVRILTGLCAAPCRMMKFSKECKHCDKCSEHGREILREFSSHVDNSYGDAHINSQFTKQDFIDRTKAAIAKVMLVKEQLRLQKVPALTELFNALTHVMSSPDNFQELGRMKTYEDGPSLVSQIVGALSALIPGSRIKELSFFDESWYFTETLEKGTCHLESIPPNTELLHFVDESNQEIVVAPMSKICENSHYFQGMFSSDFVEKTEGVRSFQVQSESCPQEVFRIFIHQICECDGMCTAVTSAEQCSTLLALSDQFLASRVAQIICGSDGPLRTYLNGNTLHTLLPVALAASSAHPNLLDAVFLTLIRFTSSENVTKALGAIVENPTVSNTFITSLKTFLTTKC